MFLNQGNSEPAHGPSEPAQGYHELAQVPPETVVEQRLAAKFLGPNGHFGLGKQLFFIHFSAAKALVIFKPRKL